MNVLIDPPRSPCDNRVTGEKVQLFQSSYDGDSGMSNTQVISDTKYLFRRDKTWWVKLAVPRKFRSILGYDMRCSLHTHDIDVARETRWPAIDRLRAKIEKISSSHGSGTAVAVPVDDQDGTRIEEQGMQQVNQYIVEIVSDSGEGAPRFSHRRENARAPAASASVLDRRK